MIQEITWLFTQGALPRVIANTGSWLCWDHSVILTCIFLPFSRGISRNTESHANVFWISSGRRVIREIFNDKITALTRTIGQRIHLNGYSNSSLKITTMRTDLFNDNCEMLVYYYKFQGKRMECCDESINTSICNCWYRAFGVLGAIFTHLLMQFNSNIRFEKKLTIFCGRWIGDREIKKTIKQFILKCR